MFNIETKSGLKKGNPEAFKEVFRLLYPRLKGYCKLFVADENQVEDIIQDCFLVLWEKRKSIKPAERVESLIFVMIRNQCLNYLKKNRMKMEKLTFDQLHYAELQHLYEMDLNEREEKGIEEELMLSFQKAVNNLPLRMKTVFVQCKLEGRKQKDVARELGISLKTVEKYIARAKILIGEELKTYHAALVAMLIALLKL